jgi:hypothetical protein
VQNNAVHLLELSPPTYDAVGHWDRMRTIITVMMFLLSPILSACQPASLQALEQRRQVIRQQCELYATEPQPFTKLTACVNDGYRKWLAEARFPYTDLSEEWFSRRLALAHELDTHGYRSAADAHSQFQALDRTFIASVNSRSAEQNLDTMTCRGSSLAVILVGGETARPNGCN